MKKKPHPWRNYKGAQREKVRRQLRGKMLPDDVANIIDVHGYRHPLDMEGYTGLWRTA